MTEGRSARRDADAERPERGPDNGRLGHDQRDRRRKPIPADTHLRDDGVFGKNALHLGRRKLRAGGEDDRVDDTSGDADPTVGGDLGGVAGGDPSVSGVAAVINGSGLGVGRKDLLERPRGGAHEQLTDRIEPDIDARKRLADPSRPTAARVVERHHRTCLGEPVALDERHPPRGKQRLRPFPQRRAAGDAHAHPTAKRGGEIGDRPRPHAPIEPLIESRHAEDHRRRQEAAGVEETPPVGNDVETAAAD